MKLVLIIFLIAVSFTLKAQSVNFSTGSVQRYDTHIVSQGETLYSISKKYQTTVDQILKLNPGIINNILQQGKPIKVPIVKNQALKTTGESHNEYDQPIIHRVEKGETVYSISKKYDNDVTTILKWNELENSDIMEGQNLIVGYEAPKKSVMGPWEMENSLDSNHYEQASCGKLTNQKDKDSCNKRLTLPVGVKENPDLFSKTQLERENEVTHDEKGIATWTHSSYDEGNFYALHATAPKGTIVTVRNLMNNKTVTVKVIGRLPSTSDNENVLIKISGSAAKKLNVLDEKFLVEISYTAPEEISLTGTN
jgi:LysM repeat protein